MDPFISSNLRKLLASILEIILFNWDSAEQSKTGSGWSSFYFLNKLLVTRNPIHGTEGGTKGRI